MNGQSHRGVLIAAATLLGVGLGGFLDGIVFHHLLQWHNMVSSIIVPVDVATMKINMAWDGVFAGATWVFTVVGLALLWRAGQRPNVPWSSKTFIGSLALGWGLFNLVEGILDHHILRIHHVRPGIHEMTWDLAYLGLGVFLVAIGCALVRAGRHDTVPRAAHRTPDRSFVGPGPMGTNSGSLHVRTPYERAKAHRR